MTATVQTMLSSSEGFEGFLNSLRDREAGAAVLSPKRFSDALSIDLQTLAAQARVHRNTLNRAPSSAGVQRYLREAVRVIRAATDLSGDVDQAIFWYRNEPLQPFAYKTAEQLVSDGRSDDLIRYLMSLEAGAAG
ncbi:MAG: hypothetical protein KDE10_02825 [Rhodobacteraceae bacterium]|nr:hypothetical protein [Paracoccaceae bacterium]